ncbi:unnamed protein product [Urochloa humidicola]
MLQQSEHAGKESMVQLLNDGISTSMVQNLLGSDTLGAVTGMDGPLQDLIKSFTTRMPDQFDIGMNAIGVSPMRNNNYSPSVADQNLEEIGFEIATDATTRTAESPSRVDVDDSGYASSDSSNYDVYSDDEDYNNGCIDLGEDNSHSENQTLDGSEETNVDIEHVPNAYEQLLSQIDGDSRPVNEEQEIEDCECIAGNPFMHVMTDLKEGDDDTITTWKKRTIHPKGEKRPDCRVTKQMGPIEIALRNAPYRKTKYIFKPVLGITFDSEPEAFNFYNLYSWEVGFGIKRSTLKRNGDLTMTKRDLRCLCDGTPVEGQYKSKKTGCKAMIRLLRSKDDGWFISKHVAEHNHELTETCGQTNEWKSHRDLEPSAIDMIRHLRENNVSLTKVHCIMGSILGSMDNIPVSKRYMRGVCRRIAKDQMDDDWQKVLDTFREIRKQDEGFQFSVKLDKEKKNITHLLWINGKSRHQYQYFGDVVTFDTTYCTNLYKMPFGLFVGVNNHFQTTIFGGVFMRDETIPSFEWVFEEFLSMMGGKLPQTIFTDQCAAMAAALSKVWKGAKHLLCKWHIFKDARTKLGPIYKWGSPFRKLFHKIINDMLTVDEFERAWAYMLDLYNLHDNEYLENIYKKREKWAKLYFRDSFCARMASTQRSESANHMLKRFVPRNCSMNRFVVQFNKLLFDRNNAEDQAEFDTKIFKNVRDQAWPVEEHAMKFYTAAAYGLLRKEIGKSTHYLAIERVEKKEYDVVCAKPRKKHPWGREKYVVTVINDGESYDCECGLYQNFGMLCSHVLRVFCQLGVCEIPKAHIHKRWTRSARDVLPDNLKGYQKDTLCMKSMTFRHSYLYVNAMAVVQDGNKDLGAFEIVSKYLKKAQKKLREYFKAKENLTSSGTNGLNRGLFMQGDYYTTESDTGADSGYETQERPMNSYGAAGSCAGMSDSELLRMKAPVVNRRVGRPKQNRFKGMQDYYSKKQKRKYNEFNTIDGDNSKKKRALPRCRECQILGHTATQCRKKEVDLTTKLPEF